MTGEQNAFNRAATSTPISALRVRSGQSAGEQVAFRRAAVGRPVSGLTVASLIPSSATVLPTDYANLQAWLDTSQDTWNDNDAVNPWTDRSGAGHDFSEATPTNKPTFKTNIIGGKPALYFVTNDRLGASNAATIIPTTASSIFAVIRINNFTSDSTTDAQLNAAIVCDSVGWMSVAVATTHGVEHYQYSGSVRQVNSAITTATDYVIHARHDGTNMFVSVNGGTETSTTCGTRGGTGGTLLIGENRHATVFMDGWISELIIYSVARSAGEVTALIGSLKTKYGIA